MRVLVHHSGRLVADHFVDKDTLRIGRVASCDLKLEGVSVARFHAVIEKTETGYVVLDMGSPSGTIVGGRRVVRESVALGYPIGVGPFFVTIVPDLEEPEIIEEQLIEPDDIVLVEDGRDLVPRPAAKVLWAATADEMDAEPVTGEVPIPLTVRIAR